MKLRSLTAGLALLASGAIIGTTAQQFASAEISSGDRTVFVPIDACRLVDTRPNSQVGPRNTPLGPGDRAPFSTQQTGTGCTGRIPTTATAIAANITAPSPTSNSFLTFWATGNRPTTSTLNPRVGQLVFNAATINLHTDNTFQAFNDAGNTHLIIDIVGYYEHHNHNDLYYTESESDARYYTQAQVDAAIAAATPATAPTLTKHTYVTGLEVTGGTTDTRPIPAYTSAGGRFKVTWQTHVRAGAGGCSLGIRVNGNPATPGSVGGAEDAIFFDTQEEVPIHLEAIYDLPAGTHTVGLFIRAESANCFENPGNFPRLVTIEEWAP